MAKTALAGNPAAQHRIGYYYHTGKYVEKDLEQAAIWYKKAAEQDLLKSQYAYARVIAFEKGGPRDYTGGLPWFIKASVPKAKPQGYGYDISLGYAKKALDWYCRTGAVPFPASHPYVDKAECLYGRGKKFYAGSKKYNIQRDYDAAFNHLTRAAKGGETKAYITLAKMHKFGYGRPRNEAEAKRLLRLAGQKRFGTKDFIKSDRLMLGAQMGSVQAHRKIAYRYLKSDKYEHNAQRAMMHLFLSKRRRFLKSNFQKTNSSHKKSTLDLILPILQTNNHALLASAHQDALDYAKDYRLPEKHITAITKSYERAVKDHNWLMRRGGEMPSQGERLFFHLLGMILLLVCLKVILSLALFLIRQWRLYIDRPRRANPF